MTVSAKMTTDYSIDGALADAVRVEEFRTAVEQARRVWMDENPCEDGHDHVTPFDQFLYGPLAQQPAACRCVDCGGDHHAHDSHCAYMCEVHGTQPAAVDEKYAELIYAVANKCPGESRHETALRYIRQAESAGRGDAQAATQPGGSDNDQ